MASEETRKPDCGSSGASSDELLGELASFLYDAYRHSVEESSDKMVLDKGQIAENEEQAK